MIQPELKEEKKNVKKKKNIDFKRIHIKSESNKHKKKKEKRKEKF